MSLLSLGWLLALGGSLLPCSVSEEVVCFSDFDERTGGCGELLGGGVSEEDCCLNIKYSFKRGADAPCQACRPAEWSEWSPWGPCTVSCMEGVQRRDRVCTGQGDCEGNKVEVRACSLQNCCPEDGGWSPWSPWSSCSVTCQDGTTQRSRRCDTPAPQCGGSCAGSSLQTEMCDTKQICPTHGAWGSWGPWGQCSGSCIKEGSGVFPVQHRQRQCNSPPPSRDPPGRPCLQEDQQVRDCTSLPFCPVAGGWGAWNSDSECSVTCGIGRVRERRVCDSPAPKHGGRYCEGPDTRQQMCNTKVGCPVDGTWSQWQPWSPCARLQEDITCTKKVGTQSRKRECEGDKFGGKWCESNHRESRSCYNAEGCRYDENNWSEWSEWGLCSPPCGKSERKRERVCQPVYPDYPETTFTQTGKLVDVFFSGTPRVRCDPINRQTKRVEEKEECKNVIEC
ncbi:complement factor properdin precursor [Xenopus tropicalis]|uniref:Complement factor properdin precursor n=1 Tax=Xenopus tropicalis TaxID=8364 RepID=Q5XGJ3_XENTR